MKTMILDVTFGNSVQPVIKEINRYQPDYIYSFGLMGSADKINIESRAINISEGIDNDNEERHKDPVIEKGLGNGRIDEHDGNSLLGAMPLARPGWWGYSGG
jgi:pyrrolidone-carboxylate peptidase